MRLASGDLLLPVSGEATVVVGKHRVLVTCTPTCDKAQLPSALQGDAPSQHVWAPRPCSVRFECADLNLYEVPPGVDIVYIASTCFPATMMARIRDRLHLAAGAWVVRRLVQVAEPWREGSGHLE